MRNIENININGEETDFIDVIYYDGTKLQIDLENNQILAWYDYQSEYEEWFLIKSDRVALVKYLSSKMSLLEILEDGKVYSVQREYEDYNNLKEITVLENFTGYTLPTKESYLSFDFTSEPEYLSFDFTNEPEHLSFTLNDYSVALRSYYQESYPVVSSGPRPEPKVKYTSITKRDTDIDMSTWMRDEYEAA